MPNRIIKESICTSDTIDNLTWFEEVFFYRLIVNCDDYGRCDARPAILKAKLFPLKSVTDKQVKDTLNKLSTVGIALVYEHDHKPFLQLKTWNDHQRIRAKVSRYPSPSGKNVAYDDGLPSCDCRMKTDESEIQSNSNSIQSEINLKEYVKKNGNFSDPDEEISLLLNDGKEFLMTKDKVNELKALYPLVNVTQSLRNMKGWLISNPRKRKTLRGIMRFVNAWLVRDQADAEKGCRIGGTLKDDGREEDKRYGIVL